MNRVKVRKYDASSIGVVEDDRDRVRLRPTIYIPTTKALGAVHIYFEIIDNSIDEITAAGSAGTKITTIYDTKTHEFTVIDDGDGIPLEELYRICTVLNSSGKLYNSEDTAYEFSGGTNGVGLKLAVYLSEYCEVTSMRNGKKVTYAFKDGLKSKELVEKSKEHGTIIKFKLSQKFIDVKGVNYEDLITRFEEKAYMFPTAKLELLVMNGEKKLVSQTYGGKTIVDALDKFKLSTDVIHIEDKRKVKQLENIDDDNLASQSVPISVAFGYSEEALDADSPMDYIISYGNTVKTYMGGAHVDGLKEGLVKYFKTVVVPNMGKRDKELPIMPSDIVSGLTGFVVAMVHKPDFRGQYKDQLQNTEAKIAVREAVYEALCEAKPTVVNPMIDFVKRVTRGRMASKKTRAKDVSNAFSKDRNTKFMDLIWSPETTHPELLLVEGKSV